MVRIVCVRKGNRWTHTQATILADRTWFHSFPAATEERCVLFQKLGIYTVNKNPLPLPSPSFAHLSLRVRYYLSLSLESCCWCIEKSLPTLGETCEEGRRKEVWGEPRYFTAVRWIVAFDRRRRKEPERIRENKREKEREMLKKENSPEFAFRSLSMFVHPSALFLSLFLSLGALSALFSIQGCCCFVHFLLYSISSQSFY
jgi:hypothetical protein